MLFPYDLIAVHAHAVDPVRLIRRNHCYAIDNFNFTVVEILGAVNVKRNFMLHRDILRLAIEPRDKRFYSLRHHVPPFGIGGGEPTLTGASPPPLTLH
jgi:hypothetical protein